jgi:hypothetical protein
VLAKKKSEIFRDRDAIIKYLIAAKFIKKGVSHSAWESQTYDYLISSFYPIAKGVSIGLGSRFAQSLRNMPKDPGGQAFGYFTHAVKDSVKLYYQEKVVEKLSKTSKETFEKELKEWVLRMNSQDFHGGNRPDKCDFFMYSCVVVNWALAKDLVFGTPELIAWKLALDKLSDQEHKTG